MNRTLISLSSLLVLLAIPLSAFGQSAPTINKVDPNETASEQTVTVTGSNFIPTPSMNQVLVGGKAAKVNYRDQSSMNVTLPANLSAGEIAVSVTARGQKSNELRSKYCRRRNYPVYLYLRMSHRQFGPAIHYNRHRLATM